MKSDFDEMKGLLKDLIDKADKISVNYEYPKHYKTTRNQDGSYSVWERPLARDVVIRFREDLK